MREITVTARTMADVKFPFRSSDQIEIAFTKLVQMRDDPFLWQGGAIGACIERTRSERADKFLERRFMTAVTHRSPNFFYEFIKRSRAIAKHRHLFARLGQMRRQ